MEKVVLSAPGELLLLRLLSRTFTCLCSAIHLIPIVFLLLLALVNIVIMVIGRNSGGSCFRTEGWVVQDCDIIVADDKRRQQYWLYWNVGWSSSGIECFFARIGITDIFCGIAILPIHCWLKANLKYFTYIHYMSTYITCPLGPCTFS